MKKGPLPENLFIIMKIIFKKRVSSTLLTGIWTNLYQLFTILITREPIISSGARTGKIWGSWGVVRGVVIENFP